METILGPIQRPFVSVTALFVLREDVEYVTINPDSTINFVGENSAAWCDSNLRHPARLSSFVPWKKKEEKKNYEIFSFHANPFKTFFLSFLPPRQIYVRDFVRIWISSLTFSGIYLFDHGPHGIWIIIFACWFNYWIKRKILKVSISLKATADWLPLTPLGAISTINEREEKRNEQWKGRFFLRCNSYRKTEDTLLHSLALHIFPRYYLL